MPVPEGIISTSTGPAEPTVDEAIIEADAELLERLQDADAEEATEEYVADDLPELP